VHHHRAGRPDLQRQQHADLARHFLLGLQWRERGLRPGGADIGAPAEALPVYVGGQPAYGIDFDKFGTGYRDNSAKNLPTGADPDGLYAVMSSNVRPAARAPGKMLAGRWLHRSWRRAVSAGCNARW
jgi:hypothetical protein